MEPLAQRRIVGDIIRLMRPVLATTFRWYAELVFTIEYRLRRLSEDRREGESDGLRSHIVRLRADIESALIANGQLQSSMDIPFVLAESSTNWLALLN